MQAIADRREAGADPSLSALRTLFAAPYTPWRGRATNRPVSISHRKPTRVFVQLSDHKERRG